MTQLPLFSDHEEVSDANPCVNSFGKSATVGQRCRGCIHLRYPLGYASKHWKCDLRELTHGSATDHRVTWNACARYKQRTEEYKGG